MLRVSEDRFTHYASMHCNELTLDSPGRAKLAKDKNAFVYSSDQLAWWIKFFDLQGRKDYDPSVDFVKFDEAHHSLRLPRNDFLGLVDGNPALKPVLSLRPKNERVYYGEYLTALRWSLAFRPGSTMA